MATKTVYQTDVNGFYIGSTEADESPLEPGVFHIPGGCVEVEPPIVGANQIAKWVEDAWTIVPDFRLTIGYDAQGVETIVTEAGKTLEDLGLTDVVPTKSLDERRKARWTQVKAERDNRAQTGGYKVGTLWFHSDPYSLIQQIGLSMLAQDLKEGGSTDDEVIIPTSWKTMDGTLVPMTVGLALQLRGAASTHQSIIFGVAENHKVAIYASNNPEDYDFSTGWPQSFQEASQ